MSSELKEYLVTFYAAEDIEMDLMEEFWCMAEDPDHADEQCRDAYPGCTTTHIEECEE